jgi:hypothetical protein
MISARKKTPMTLEVVRGTINDILDIASLSDAQVARVLVERVNGSATLTELLTAALSVARRRESKRIAELESELEDAKDHPELEDELRDLRRKAAALSVEMKELRQ